jgi:hypothetical protein
MQATAPSRILNVNGATIITIALDIETLIRALPRRDINRCPAIMFAVSRTHKVIGRIKLLTSSINTMKFIRATGVPWGNRWDSMCLVFFIHPNIMIVSHVHKDIGRFIVKCAVVEKICGYIAKKFIGKMVMNIRIKIIFVPFSEFGRVYDTSFLNVLMIFFFAVSSVDAIFHSLEDGTIATTAMINQALDTNDVDGSKVENKLVIIFTFFLSLRLFFLLFFHYLKFSLWKTSLILEVWLT